MPQAANAIETRFFLNCSALDGSTIGVAQFTGTDSISKPYCFEILLISNNPDIDPDTVINSAATLLIRRDEEMQPYSGIVTSFSYVETTVDYSSYLLILRPAFWLLELNIQTRIFQKMTIPDIIKKVIRDSGLTISFSFDTGSYPEREYVAQYEESDLAFINRLSEEYGIWYFFIESAVNASDASNITSTEELIFTDKPSNFEEIPTLSTVKYRSSSGMVNRIDDDYVESIHKLKFNRNIIPAEASGKTYNYRTPEVDLSHTKPISSGDVGKVYRYGGNFKDAGNAKKSVEVLAKRLLMHRNILEGSGDCAGFKAGYRFTLEDHARASLNETYLLTSITHRGSSPQLERNKNSYNYLNDFTCIPSNLADNFAPDNATPVPKIPGVMTALIETESSDYAALDDKGRYKVRMPFDRSDSDNYKASKYMRLAQPYSGADYGIHFPSHEGSEMIIGYVDGNPDKPLGLGTVPNANTLSPVKTATKQKGMIRTAGGNEIIFDDTDKKQKIALTTNAENHAVFDDENKLIEIVTTDGNGLLLDDGNKKTELNAGDNIISLVYASSGKGIELTTVDGHTIIMSDSGKHLSIRTKAGNEIELSDTGKSITFTDAAGKNMVTLDGNSGITLESSGEIIIKASKDLKIQAENISIKSTKKTSFDAADELTIKSGSAKGKFKKGGDIVLEGSKINIKSSGNLTLKGSKIAEN